MGSEGSLIFVEEPFSKVVVNSREFDVQGKTLLVDPERLLWFLLNLTILEIQWIQFLQISGLVKELYLEIVVIMNT